MASSREVNASTTQNHGNVYTPHSSTANLLQEDIEMGLDNNGATSPVSNPESGAIQVALTTQGETDTDQCYMNTLQASREISQHDYNHGIDNAIYENNESIPKRHKLARKPMPSPKPSPMALRSMTTPAQPQGGGGTLATTSLGYIHMQGNQKPVSATSDGYTKMEVPSEVAPAEADVALYVNQC